VASLREDGQLIRGKGGVKPGKVVGRQQEIVLIDDDADVRVGAQTGVIRPEVPMLEWLIPVPQNFRG